MNRKELVSMTSKTFALPTSYYFGSVPAILALTTLKHWRGWAAFGAAMGISYAQKTRNKPKSKIVEQASEAARQAGS
jgi:hypothetical protein